MSNAIASAAYATTIRDVRYHSVICFSILVWHCLLTFDQDVQYIWTMRNNSPFKWIYFFLRYVSVLASVMHNWLIVQLADGSNPPILCSVWHAYAPGFAQILSNFLEFILAVRIYALYNCSKRMAFLLLLLISMEFAGTVRMLWLLKGSNFYEVCLLIRLTDDSKDQIVLVFIVHCVLIGLILYKYFFAFGASRNKNPLILLVVRDGGTMYATLSVILLSLVIICGLGTGREVAIFFWVVSLFSITGCHVILSMERFARKEVSIDYPPIFSSHISLGTFDSA